MSLRHGHALPPRQGRLDRLFNFTRAELASARLASLAIGVRPDEARPGDKRGRVGEESEEEEEFKYDRALYDPDAMLDEEEPEFD